MRFASLLAGSVAAASVAAASSPSSNAAALPTSLMAQASNHATAPAADVYTSSLSSLAVQPSSTTHAASSASRANATTSRATDVTGGAIPQQMQASMAGLIGFCIMGLVML
ncbi:hypothetical protein CDD82_2220 [Ophiocordyceps australis]|uniref:REJ domain-containing protein n=1 Tax=Ophiocordyceps australis TaxID=1399860 RepID=A0A2C5ZIS1_9HYPO|nr:hypothetical protein CDD82_2220 [Ophiocordyceps australis]